MGKEVRIDYKQLKQKASEIAQNTPSKHGGRDRPTEVKVVGSERRN